MSQVLMRDGDKLVALAPVHRRLCWLNIPRGSSFDLNETQYVSIPSDQVDLTFTTWRTKVASHHDIAELSQVKVSVFLASAAGLLVRRARVRSKGFVRYPIECADGGVS
jgi:hypothetical protein